MKSSSAVHAAQEAIRAIQRESSEIMEELPLSS